MPTAEPSTSSGTGVSLRSMLAGITNISAATSGIAAGRDVVINLGLSGTETADIVAMLADLRKLLEPRPVDPKDELPPQPTKGEASAAMPISGQSSPEALIVEATISFVAEQAQLLSLNEFMHVVELLLPATAFSIERPTSSGDAKEGGTAPARIIPARKLWQSDQAGFLERAGVGVRPHSSGHLLVQFTSREMAETQRDRHRARMAVIAAGASKLMLEEKLLFHPSERISSFVLIFTVRQAYIDPTFIGEPLSELISRALKTDHAPEPDEKANSTGKPLRLGPPKYQLPYDATRWRRVAASALDLMWANDVLQPLAEKLLSQLTQDQAWLGLFQIVAQCNLVPFARRAALIFDLMRQIDSLTADRRGAGPASDGHERELQPGFKTSPSASAKNRDSSLNSKDRSRERLKYSDAIVGALYSAAQKTPRQTHLADPSRPPAYSVDKNHLQLFTYAVLFNSKLSLNFKAWQDATASRIGSYPKEHTLQLAFGCAGILHLFPPLSRPFSSCVLLDAYARDEMQWIEPAFFTNELGANFHLARQSFSSDLIANWVLAHILDTFPVDPAVPPKDDEWLDWSSQILSNRQFRWLPPVKELPPVTTKQGDRGSYVPIAGFLILTEWHYRLHLAARFDAQKKSFVSVLEGFLQTCDSKLVPELGRFLYGEFVDQIVALQSRDELSGKSLGKTISIHDVLPPKRRHLAKVLSARRKALEEFLALSRPITARRIQPPVVTYLS